MKTYKIILTYETQDKAKAERFERLLKGFAAGGRKTYTNVEVGTETWAMGDDITDEEWVGRREPRAHSTVAQPVKVTREIAKRMGVDDPKRVREACVAAGVHPATARTTIDALVRKRKKA